MFATTVLVLLVLFVCTVYWYLISQRKNNNHRLPGPKPEWIFGNLRKTGVLSGRTTLFEVYAELKDVYGDAFSFWLGPYYSIVISKIEHVQQVLADRHTYDMDDFTSRNFGVLFPAGLISLRGDDWKRHARFILPMLKRAKVLPYLDTVITCTDQFIEEILAKRNGQIHTDIIEQSQRLLLNIFALIAFDYDLQSTSKVDDYDLRDAFNDFVRIANQFILMSGLPLWLGKLILKMNRKYQRAKSIMKHHIMNIINEEQKEQEQQIADNKRKNLVSSLVAAVTEESTKGGTFMTPNEVFDEVSLLMLGGFETSSTVLSWFIFYMSKYPGVQAKMKVELQEHNSLGDRPLTQDTLDSLIYIECVLKEVLRFAPIVSGTSRQATRDTMLGDVEVKKNDTIVLAVENLHRDPRYWKIDPSKFYPERFLEEDKNPPHCALMTFGGGHRACAGQDLAFFELKIIIARLMQSVTFSDPGNEANNSGGMVQRITIYPKNIAVRVCVEPVGTIPE